MYRRLLVAAVSLAFSCSTPAAFGETDANGAAEARDPASANSPPPPADADALALWDDNGDGRITCTEARSHGIAPVTREHPAWPFVRDGDGDGVACE